MELEELWEVLGWVHKNIVESRLQKRYSALHGVLNQNTQPNQAKQPFEEQAKTLLDLLRGMPMKQLTTAQINFLTNIGMAQYMGLQGATYVEGALYRNAIDTATAANQIKQAIDQINKALEKINQLRAGLDGVVQPLEHDADRAILRVTFANDAAIDNVVNLKRWGTVWHDVARGVAMAHDMPPEEVRVIGAHRGSVILDLAVVYGFAKTMSFIITAALEATMRVHEIRHEAEKVRSLKLANTKIEAELRQAAKQEKEQRAASISDETVKALNLKANGDGEKINALEKSVKLLVDFLDKGGEVDLFVQDDAAEPVGDGAEDETVARRELRLKFEQIRALEDKLRRLEYKTDDSPEPPADG